MITIGFPYYQYKMLSVINNTRVKAISKSSSHEPNARMYTVSDMMKFRDNAPELKRLTQIKIFRLLGIRMNKRKMIVDVLNKLVKENAMEVADDLDEIIFGESLELYEFLADCLFNKAIQEQMFVDVYAELCHELDRILELPAAKNGKRVFFSSLLLRKCQTMFQSGIVELSQLKKKEVNEYERAEHDEEMFKKKKNYLGLILFITALYKQEGMITVKIMIEGCLKLLFNRIKAKHDLTCVEVIHKLLMNAGAKLEKDKGVYSETLDNMYAQLEGVKHYPSIGKRDIFMIQDVLEARKKWISDASSSSKPSFKFEIKSVTVIHKSGSKPPATATEAAPSKANVDSVKNQINSSLDEYRVNNSVEDLYMDFEDVMKKGFLYMLIPSIFNYCVEKNLSEKDTKKITSALSGYKAFNSSKHNDLAKGIDELLNVLQDVEDVTETVISQFSRFMSFVLCHLNFCIATDFVNCLCNLKDNSPFCSLKEKKKYGASALFFVGTLSAIQKVNPVKAKTMVSHAKHSRKIFNNEEQRIALYDMYNITALL